MADVGLYIIPLEWVFAANGTLSDSYQVNVGETIHILKWYWTFTSALFMVYDIRMTGNLRLTNANQTKGIQGGTLQQATTSNIGLSELPKEIIVQPTQFIAIDIINQNAGANTIRVSLVGWREFTG